jgi:hypothetical protein
MVSTFNDFVFAPLAPAPAPTIASSTTSTDSPIVLRLCTLFSNTKEAQSFAFSFPASHPIVFLPHADKAEIQRAASAKIPVLVEVHSMQGAFDALKLSGVKFVLVNPLQNKTTIDVAWMSVAKQRGMEVVFALPDLQSTLQLNKSRPIEEFQKLARLLAHYHIDYHIVSFARHAHEILSAEEIAALHTFLEEEKLLHHLQMQFSQDEQVGFSEEAEEVLE